MKRVLRIAGLALFLAAPALAHDGPPFPILVDEPFGDRTLSVWADPDVGVGTFYLYIPEEKGTGPDEGRISIWVEPADGRLPEARHDAEPSEGSVPYQRVIYADFDRRGLWHARFTLENGDVSAVYELDIDVTPPGAGKIDLVWFLSPFLLIAFLWGKAMHERRKYARTPS